VLNTTDIELRTIAKGNLLGVDALQEIDHRLHLAAVVLAEELDFERAARRLKSSVAVLKEQIVQLENLLSLILFENDSENVHLTPSGRHYIEQIRKGQFI
jgi:DNA-binding transcriptional LysR family regulator